MLRRFCYPFLITAGLILTGSLVFLFKDVPSPTKLTKQPAPVSTQILDRRGQLLYEVYGDQNRTPIKIQDLPDFVLQATIAIEDKNFYSHFGLDLGGITRAAFKTLTGQRLEGGSTITQQLVKTALLHDPRRTLIRKIREAVLALLTELIYSKEQILEMYLNHAPYGGTAYGIESAARRYFNKSARELNLAEAALLAGLPQAPTKYSPFGAHPELAKNRQEQVLRRLVEDGYINQEQAAAAAAQSANYADEGIAIKAPHFTLYVRDLLVDRYGEDLVNFGGLRVTTSLDLSLQEAAQASLSAEINRLAHLKVGNGAALITKPDTGEVLAMIGSRNYFDVEHDGNVNVTLRPRQPGSAIKPINYAAALLKGATASTPYLDLPTCFIVTGQKPYCPQNYDNTWHGPTQMRFALGNSYNLPAVKQLALNGVESMIATASAMGITGWDDPSQYGLSLTLGGGEVKMVELAVAFGVFANSGVKVPLNPILKVETYQGQVLEELPIQDLADLVSASSLDWEAFWQKLENPAPPLTLPVKIEVKSPYQSFLDRFFPQSSSPPPPLILPHASQEIDTVLPQEVAFIISHILADNNARSTAFGSQSELVIRGKTISVKTGTTNEMKDNWTIGYTPDFLVAVWVGNNDSSAMSYVASGVTGASPIWNDLMRLVLRNQPDHFFSQPDGVVTAQVCALTGLLPTTDTSCDTRTELFVKEQLPPFTYPIRRQIWVRRDTKVPPLPHETVTDLDLEEHTIFSDAFINEFCLDCPYPIEAETGKISFPQFIVTYPLSQSFHPRGATANPLR